MTVDYEAGFLKTASLGYDYDGSNYTLYVQVIDTSSGTAKTTNYAFTLSNLTSSQTAVPAINAYFQGGYVGTTELATPYTSPVQDIGNPATLSNQSVLSNASLSVTCWHNNLTAAQAGQTVNGYGPLFQMKIQSLISDQSVIVGLSHEITPVNQWIVSIGAGEGAME